MATFMPGAFCLSRCLQPQTLLHQRQSLLPPRRHCSPNACDTYAASSWKPLGGKRPGPGPARSNAERTPELGTGGEGEEEEVRVHRFPSVSRLLDNAQSGTDPQSAHQVSVAIRRRRSQGEGCSQKPGFISDK